MDLYRIKAINKFEINKNTSTFHKHLHQQYGLITVDYDGNLQGSRTAGQDASVTVVAIGFDTAAYVTVTSELGRNKANNISLVSSLERNYENPA